MKRYEVLREAPDSGYVSIGIPTYNGSQRVQWLLESARKTGLRSDAVLAILDDGSPRPGELAKLLGLAEEHGARLLRHPRNLGITAAWNDLVNDGQSQICVLLNDDLILTPNWLDDLVYFLEQNECGAASPTLLFCTESDVPGLLAGQAVTPRHPVTKAPTPEYSNQDPLEAPGVVMCALGSGFGFRRSVFNALGGFDEQMVQIYNESDFGTAAAARLKLPSYCLPTRFWHLWSASFKENPELGQKASQDRSHYVAKWGGDFDVTHPKFMHGTMPPRAVRWIAPNRSKQERELTVQ